MRWRRKSEKKAERSYSLKNSLIALVLACWILPLFVITVVTGVIIIRNIDQQVLETASTTAFSAAQICTERIDAAVDASRSVSYDSTFSAAYGSYVQKRDYLEFYRSINMFLTQKYKFDDKFMFVTMKFYNYGDEVSSKLDSMDYYTYNEALFVDLNARNFTGTQAYTEFKQWDMDQVCEAAQQIGTSIGFMNKDDKIYMYRNIYIGSARPCAMLVMRLNTSVWFDTMNNVPWSTDIMLTLNSAPVQMRGSPLDVEGILGEFRSELKQEEEKDNRVKDSASLTVDFKGQKYLCGELKKGGYTFAYTIKVDNTKLMENVKNLRYVNIIMALALIPMLFIVIRFFYANISRPINVLVKGAGEIENGKFGTVVEPVVSSSEFRYLTDAFNEMSSQLKYQFDKIYMEELALRDAKIMALQSQINPHFLNNTLEIINWEARFADDVKVSRMIEALSTMLDAAMDRKGRPVVHLSQEIMYVDSYLYIIRERLGKRLTVEKEIDQSLLDLYVPRLVLQPIIENAVEHGIAPQQHGVITIRVYRDGENLVLEIENNGAMAKEDEERVALLLSEDYDPSREGAGNLGIRNVHQRLRIIYGQNSGLSIKMTSDGHALARIVIPIIQSEQ